MGSQGMGGPSTDLEYISPAIIMIQSWEPAVAFRGFNLIDKDFSWNEFCFMMEEIEAWPPKLGDCHRGRIDW